MSSSAEEEEEPKREEEGSSELVPIRRRVGETRKRRVGINFYLLSRITPDIMGSALGSKVAKIPAPATVARRRAPATYKKASLAHWCRKNTKRELIEFSNIVSASPP